MSLWLPVLKELDRGPDRKKTTNQVYEFMITDPAVLHLVRNRKNSKDFEEIEKLAKMNGTNVILHLPYKGSDINGFLEHMLDCTPLMIGLLIVSRGKKQEEPCITCRQCEEEEQGFYHYFDGCYKVPGMEDYGCCRCRGFTYLSCERRDLLTRGELYRRW